MSDQLIGYIITGVWTLVNLCIIAAVIVFFVLLFKFLLKANKQKNETSAAPQNTPHEM